VEEKQSRGLLRGTNGQRNQGHESKAQALFHCPPPGLSVPLYTEFLRCPFASPIHTDPSVCIILITSLLSSLKRALLAIFPNCMFILSKAVEDCV